MIADSVTVRTRSYARRPAGSGSPTARVTFSVSPAEGPLSWDRNRPAPERRTPRNSPEEWKIKEVVRKYSSFVPHPIKVNGQVVNDQKPIWSSPGASLRRAVHPILSHLTHRTDEKPLWHLHLAADSPIQFRAILYCPPTQRGAVRLALARRARPEPSAPSGCCAVGRRAIEDRAELDRRVGGQVEVPERLLVSSVCQVLIELDVLLSETWLLGSTRSASGPLTDLAVDLDRVRDKARILAHDLLIFHSSVNSLASSSGAGRFLSHERGPRPADTEGTASRPEDPLPAGLLAGSSGTAPSPNRRS